MLEEKDIKTLELAIKKAWAELKLADLEPTEENTFKVIATDDTVDRDWEVLTLDWWNFSNYMKNPVVFADHNSWSINYIVGKATNIYMENNKVIVEWVFTDATPAGQIAMNLYKGGFLKAVSVGFLVQQRDANNPKKIIEKELYELSFVGIPCNPEAVSLDWKAYKTAVEMWLIKEVEDQDEEETPETAIDELKEEIQELKSLVVSMHELLDDKSKHTESMDFENKEFLQELNRSISEQLRRNKKTA